MLMNNFQRKNKKLKTIPPPEDPLPIYVQSRLDIWTKLKAQQDELIAQKPRDLLTVTLPDGKKVEGLTWETNPLDVAKTLSNSLANEVVVAKVNGQLWDLERPFEEDSTLHLLKFSEPEAKAVFWNSAAFVLGESLERAYGVQNNGLLATVASIENGLYCDVHVEKKTVDSIYELVFPNIFIYKSILQLTVKHFPEIESKLVRSRYTKNVFERLEVDKNNLLEMFAYNKFRIDEINEKIADGAKAIVYRCGIFIDICQLPHVRYNKRVKAFKLRTVTCE